MNDQDKLNALRSVDFNWFVGTESVWSNTNYDVPLHHDVLMEILSKLKNQKNYQSQLGWVIVGKGGAGKTHLLRTLRKEASNDNVGFIMVDMTGVNNFWDTVLLAYIDSLKRPFIKGNPQHQSLFEHLLKNGKSVVNKLKKTENRKDIVNLTNKIIKAFFNKHRFESLEYQDVIRALILTNSDDYTISNIGYSWLQGLGIDEQDKKHFEFKSEKKSSIDVVKAISWIMSLRKPVIIALDQLDAIVKEHSLNSSLTHKNNEGIQNKYSLAISNSTNSDDDAGIQNKHSLAIIEEIAGGMSALVNTIAKRTLVIISCLESTWEILCKTVHTNKDRFYPPVTLNAINNTNLAQQMIELRLANAYKDFKIIPEYPTWPFAPKAFEEASGLFPRELLQKCDEHRNICIKNQKITVLKSFENPNGENDKIPNCNNYKNLISQYETLKQQAAPELFLDEKNEDTLMDNLLETACLCLVKEATLPKNVDTVVDLNFHGEKSFSFLHVRIRLIYRDEQDREKHFCLRAILKTHATAYNNRLKAAMTASGIDKNITFRKLIIIKTETMETSEKTVPLKNQFLSAGGIFVNITHDEIRSLWALQEMMKQNHPDFNDWLSSRKPVSDLPFIKTGLPELCSHNPPVIDENDKDEKHKIDLGYKLISSSTKEKIAIPLSLLTKHTVILASSGSGKTVLIKRLIEEAALAKIPSIVFDCANDLTRLSDPWPTKPEAFTDEDQEKAKQYFSTTETVVWTPGLTNGNPFFLDTLPDFKSLLNDEDELNLAITMVMEGFKHLVAKGSSTKSKKQLGVFAASLEYFAQNGGGQLKDLIDLLSDLPHEASGDITNAEKLALEISDILKAQIQVDPLLKQTGIPLDPAVLFGINNTNKTRISVINLIGLPGINTQHQFLNQLAMTLFTWIKKNPAPENKPIRGLLIIDEAKDYIPSGNKSTPCKTSLLQLVAQARKYGLGLIFATQTPKSIDHNIIANCSTHFYGQVNSPASIEVVQDMLKQKGSSGKDIAKLGTGKFYVYLDHDKSVQKIATSLCLSYHPSTTLTDHEIKEKAIASKNVLT